MKRTILIAAAAIALASCGGNAQRKTANTTGRAETTTASDRRNDDMNRQYAGTYTGTIPAADGPGIEMKLKLKHDGMFDLHMKYIDRKTDANEKGRYTVDGNTLTLRPEDGKQTRYFRIEGNRLNMLNADRQPATGATADRYVLTKQNN